MPNELHSINYSGYHCNRKFSVYAYNKNIKSFHRGNHNAQSLDIGHETWSNRPIPRLFNYVSGVNICSLLGEKMFSIYYLVQTLKIRNCTDILILCMKLLLIDFYQDCSLYSSWVKNTPTLRVNQFSLFDYIKVRKEETGENNA